MNFKKFLKYLMVTAISVLLIYGFYLLKQIFSANTKFSQAKVYVYIPTNATYQEVKVIIQPYIEDMHRFEAVAQKRNYIDNVKSGRFLFLRGMSSFELVSTLRKNDPVKLSFNNQERIENLAGKVGNAIEPDSLQILNAFKDPQFLKENGLTEDNVFVLLVPNTYEIYWNTSAIKFRDKMLKEYKSFWTNERVELAKKQGLTPVEATILASIVHKESVKKDERPRIAGVYLNRMRAQMPLQADPTVIYAIKKKTNNFDQIIKRVLYQDLLMTSPYNTYKVLGLPPGPIAMPDITAIEAVLKPETHKYIYFCASVTKFGYHEFAETLEAHNVNAKKYSEWIANQGVNR